MSTIKRVFLIVLDSLGIGEMPDAAYYNDVGSHTLKACWESGELQVHNLQKLGLFHIDDIDFEDDSKAPIGSFARMTEASQGKDTTIGHWEIAGIISENALPVYPEGFPEELMDEYKERTGRGILCNKPYSGTDVLKDYGQQHVNSGDLIIYTSADSVFQVAAHEEIVPVETLYSYCQIAREILKDEHGVGRVIARPFTGEYPNYKRTENRHDFSLIPSKATVLDSLVKHKIKTIGIGKIYDIFAGKGITETVKTKNNDDGMDKLIAYLKDEWNGLCFVNLVDFDMLYGHRNDVLGYTEALNQFDRRLGECMELLKEGDVLMITADHGCDPSTPSTDHSREYTPLLVYGSHIKEGIDLGTRDTFADIGASIADLLEVNAKIDGTSFIKEIIK